MGLGASQDVGMSLLMYARSCQKMTFKLPDSLDVCRSTKITNYLRCNAYFLHLGGPLLFPTIRVGLSMFFSVSTGSSES